MIAGVYAHQANAEQRKLVYDNKDRIGKVNATKEARDIMLDMTGTAPKKEDEHADSSGRYDRGLNASIVKLTIT